MPERSAPDAALRFVRDLTALREERGVSLGSLHESTRVPVDVLEAFEATALYGNRLFNRVYLRSLVRAYAGTIGFDPDRAVLALEEALAGQYDGALLREPEPPDDAPAPEIEPDDAAEETPEIVTPPEVPPAPVPPPPPEEPLPPPPVEPVAPYPTTPAPRAETQAPPVIAWDAVSGSTRNPRVQTRDFPWGGVIAGVVGLALLIAGIVWWMGRSPEPPREPVAAAPADTTVQQQPAAPPQPVSLPDTLALRVTATNGPVSDIKIQRDDDVRRPYWIEQGDARDFTFTSRAVIERELEDATITVQGVAYPTTRTDAQGRLVITRDTVLRLLQQR